MTLKIQHSFAAGELSPALFARVDLDKYQVGAALMKNFYVDYRGGAKSRPGTMYVGRTKFESASRLIPFKFSYIQTYVLEFGDQYIRFIMNGAYVLEANKTITVITDGSPVTVTSAAHGFANGDWVYISGTNVVPHINGRYFIVAGATTNTFTLKDLNGNAFNGGGGASGHTGTAARVYEISTPYMGNDLRTLKFTQSADTMTLVHPSYAPRDLTRTAHTAWTLTTITFGASIAAPTGIAATSPSSVNDWARYTVTAVSDTTGDESLAGTSADVDGNLGAFKPNTVTWNAVTDAAYYNIYRSTIVANETVSAGSILGFLGSAEGLEFKDPLNITVDFSLVPPINKNPFNATNKYPGAVCYFQQRRVFARTNNNPTNIWATQSGAFKNMNVSRPTRDDDAIVVTLASLEVDEIKHLVPMSDGIITLTGGDASDVPPIVFNRRSQLVSSGTAGGPITPANIVAKPQAYYDILYVQGDNASVQGISYSVLSSNYTVTDYTALASHILEGRSIREWASAAKPDKVIWAVMDDGILLSFTFLKEQEVYGWARHDTQGRFRSVCSIIENNIDATYFIVIRKINGSWIHLVERLAERYQPDADSAWCVDCALSTSLVYPGTTLDVSVQSGATLNFDAGSAVFSSGDVGKVIRVGGGVGTITSFVSTTRIRGVMTTPILRTLPNGTYPQFGNDDWSLTSKISSATNLYHLEGESVVGVSDGVPLAPQVVTNGVIAISPAGSRVVIGKKFTPVLRTLRVDLGESGREGTVQGKAKKISYVTIRLFETAGIKCGGKLNRVKPVKDCPAIEGTLATLVNNDCRYIMDPDWTRNGQFYIQQDLPLPAEILGVIPDVTVGG